MIYRAEGRNINWQEIESKTLAVVEVGWQNLLERGWRFSSITIDGRSGVIALITRLLPDAPVQLCLFHQKAIMRRYLTTRPKTRYAGFLKDPNEQGQFKHRRTRSALHCLTVNAPWLFTAQRHPERIIPITTNSCDGSFAHWKARIRIHCGLRKDRRSKMIRFLLSEP